MGFAEVNYLAVGLAAVLSFVLGMLWYSPLLFAKAWMAAQRATPRPTSSACSAAWGRPTPSRSSAGS